MTKYTNLDLDHKKEFLVNATALYMACTVLAEMADDDSIPLEIWKAAYSKIAAMSDEGIELTVQNLEAHHRPFNSDGMPVALNLARIDMKVED